jgi:hypothetical protein
VQTQGRPRNAGENLKESPFEHLSWKEEDRAASLQAVFDQVQGKTLDAIDWYIARKALRSTLSQLLRLGAICFATIGGVVPLLRAAELWPKSLPGEMGQIGYVAFAFAAGCVAIDRFFGLSSAWMRWMTTALTLQRMLAEFQLDWSLMQVRLAGRPPGQHEVEQMLLRIKEFRGAVMQVIERETQSWVVEFQSNLAELHKVAQARTESLEPGVIAVTVTNGTEADGELVVLVDGSPRERFRGTHCRVTPVFPGHHTVTVRGAVSGIPAEASSSVSLAAGALAMTTLVLPVPRPAPPGTASGAPLPSVT